MLFEITPLLILKNMKDLTPIELLKSLMNSHNLTIKELCLELKINVKDLLFYLEENEKIQLILI